MMLETVERIIRVICWCFFLPMVMVHMFMCVFVFPYWLFTGRWGIANSTNEAVDFLIGKGIGDL